MKWIRWLLFVGVLWSLLLTLVPTGFSREISGNDLSLVIDGELITSDPPPVLRQGRTLVPLRLVAESLGAQVEWIAAQNAVRIDKAGSSVLLRIDNHLVENRSGVPAYSFTDVAPLIISGRTYVPLRLVGNALGVTVSWDEPTRTVNVFSSQYVPQSPMQRLKVTSVVFGQVITGKVELGVEVLQPLPAGNKEVRFLLLSPDTGRGFVIARGVNITGKYAWVPDLRTTGPRLLVAAVYDAMGRFLAGDVVAVDVAPTVSVSLRGATPGQTVERSLTLSAEVSFLAAAVSYEIVSLNTGKSFTTAKLDPLGNYTWSPTLEDAGEVSIRVIAHSVTGIDYPSGSVVVSANPSRRLELRGVSHNATVERPVSLSVSANFQVTGAQYVLRDLTTGEEQILASVPTAAHRFFPGPAQAGRKELYARVMDTAGAIHITPAVSVTISGRPLLLLSGVGPNEVVTGQVSLNTTDNVALEVVRYYLTNRLTGERRELGSAWAGTIVRWTPTQTGEWSIQAEGHTALGAALWSESISFRSYIGTIHGPRPVVQRDQFMTFASNMALNSRRQTGMSAALQTAQAILETGWGQGVPVDKYSGLFSNNLFGIKGTGPAGTVISNTWEEHNGVVFRIDANFRAYHTIEQAWDDHKRLLLTATRYQPYRDVMHDSTLGAWALRRAGYATDSQYAVKLIDIISRFSLWTLDEVGV